MRRRPLSSPPCSDTPCVLCLSRMTERGKRLPLSPPRATDDNPQLRSASSSTLSRRTCRPPGVFPRASEPSRPNATGKRASGASGAEQPFPCSRLRLSVRMRPFALLHSPCRLSLGLHSRVFPPLPPGRVTEQLAGYFRTRRIQERPRSPSTREPRTFSTTASSSPPAP